MNGLILPSAAAKPKPVQALPAQRCGNCWYHAKVPGDPNMVMCQGGPPTAIMMGMGQDIAGRPVPQIISFWPQLQATQRRCALWASQGEDIGDLTQ